MVKRKDTILVGVAAVVIALAAAFYLSTLSGPSTAVSTTLTIDFYSASSPINPGNTTTWTWDGSSWSVDTEVNLSGNSVWIFKDLPSDSDCLSQLLAAKTAANFTVETETFPMGIKVNGIAGLVNQNGGGPGWQYYVNGVYANKACNLYTISNGDSVSWQYKPLAS
jgi:hypothetical protein